MKTIRKKLRSDRGSSMVLALFLMLVALMVSHTILAAAATAGQNVVQQRESQQAYLTVSSAAETFRDSVLSFNGDNSFRRIVSTKYKDASMEEVPFDLSSISEEVLVVVEQMAAERNIRVTLEKKGILHRKLIGSPGHVKRVMMNILSNAVKYNKENGQIYMSCQELPSQRTDIATMEFICRDTGIGMSEAFQKRIFEPFAQEDSGSRTKYAGTGLGMPITKKLIEKMGGTITFESKKVWGLPL